MRLQIRRLHYLAAVLAAAVVQLFAAAIAHAGLDETRAGYMFHYFSDVDGVSVYTHYGNAAVLMASSVALAFQYAHDTVVIPAIEAPPGSQEAADAITTASRPISNSGDPFADFVKERDEIQASLSYKGAKLGYYVSIESDWFAQMVTLGYNQGLVGDNLNLSGVLSYGWDDIEPLADADTPGGSSYRNTLHGNIVATQIVSPTTVVRAGGEFNKVEGLQHDLYRNVYVDGTNVPEVHPLFRNRWSVFGRVSQYITNRSSVKVEYRYYQDDWDISSHTIGGKLSQYVGDSFVVRYRYRYYSQVPAYFFRNQYNIPGGVSGLQTNDYRLGDYGAHLFGGNLTWYPGGALARVGFLKGAHFVISYEHYFNSNNFSANVYETGLRVSF